MDARMRRLPQVRKKPAPVPAIASQRKPQRQRQQQHPNAVIPVKQLKSPALLRQLLGIRPRPPAKHRDDAKHHRPRITVENKHLCSLCTSRAPDLLSCAALALPAQTLRLSTALVPLSRKLCVGRKGL